MGSRSLVVYQRLREAILRNEFQVGARLSEMELASRYAVSRTPVREALRMLELDGLLRRDGRRVRIVSISRTDVLNIYPIVEVLESLAGRLACPHLCPEHLTRMRDLNGLLRAGTERQNAADSAQVNEEIHLVYINLCHNPRLVDELAKFHLLMQRFRVFGLQIPGRRQSSVLEHDAIIEAFGSGDGERVERAIRVHIAAARETLLETIQALAYLPS